MSSERRAHADTRSGAQQPLRDGDQYCADRRCPRTFYRNPTQAARHEGYETAFLQTATTRITVG